jgi:hypothetical protein
MSAAWTDAAAQQEIEMVKSSFIELAFVRCHFHEKGRWITYLKRR